MVLNSTSLGISNLLSSISCLLQLSFCELTTSSKSDWLVIDCFQILIESLGLVERFSFNQAEPFHI